MNPEPVRLTDLVDLDQLQKIQDAFAFATGVASIITDTEGVPITRPSNFCRLCSEIIRKSEKGCRNCMHSDAVLGKLHPDGPIMQPCLSGGLWDGGTSICVGETHIANWLIGQIRNEAQNEDLMMAYAREIGADEEDFRSALREVTVMPVEQFGKVCDALHLIAKQISELAYNNLALRKSQANLHTTLNSIGDAVIATDEQGRISRMNPVAQKLTGWSFADAEGRPLSDVFAISDQKTGERLPPPSEQVLRNGVTVQLGNTTLLTAKDGRERMISDSAAPIRDPGGLIIGAVLVFRDVTDQLHVEEQLRQSQKMDAIGQLAGGIAHDFNNMLGGILGAADMLERYAGENPQARKMLGLIVGAAEQAGALTQALLDFSRKGKTLSTPIDLHQSIRDAIAILEHSIDRKIVIQAQLNARNSVIVGDPAQLQSAVLNLGINARDAMPSGGAVTFCTEDITISSGETWRGETLEPGDYVALEVQDTGTGIDPRNLGRIFEPFFTTKKVGEGTGLGLAAVYATVHEHNGRIKVTSDLHQGTTFFLLFPSHASAVHTHKDRTEEWRSPANAAQVLLVDDEPYMRSAAQAILEHHGYRVTCAENGAMAQTLLRNNPDGYDLAIIDMVMPGLNGAETFAQLRAIRPDLAVVFSSGFSREFGMRDLLNQPGVKGFIPKPYRRLTLLQLVENALK